MLGGASGSDVALTAYVTSALAKASGVCTCQEAIPKGFVFFQPSIFRCKLAVSFKEGKREMPLTCCGFVIFLFNYATKFGPWLIGLRCY